MKQQRGTNFPWIFRRALTRCAPSCLLKMTGDGPQRAKVPGVLLPQPLRFRHIIATHALGLPVFDGFAAGYRRFSCAPATLRILVKVADTEDRACLLRGPHNQAAAA